MTDDDPRDRRPPASEARLQVLNELSTDWYWAQDDQYRFVHIGMGAADRSRPELGVLLGHTRWDDPTTNLDAAQWAAHRAMLDARETFRDFEYGFCGADGVRRWFSVSGRPVFGAGGAFRGYHGIARDITERRRNEQMHELEHAVARSLAEARDASEALRAVIRAVCLSEGWEWGRYWRREDAAGALRTVEFWAVPGSGPEAHVKALRDLLLEPGKGLAGAVLKSGEALWVPDVPNDPRTELRNIVPGLRTRSSFLFPLFDEGGVLGVLTFSSSEVRPPDARLLDAVRAIGSQLGQYLSRRRAEEGLRRFRVALDHSADMILLIDRTSMRYVDVNETVCRLLGYSYAEITSMGPQDVLPVERAALECAYDALIAAPANAGSLRSEYICKDGSRLPFESTRHVIRSGDGYLIAAISRDIRERLAAEKALRDSETRFRTIFERSNAGITIWDADGRFLAVNQAHARFLGYTVEELVQRSIEVTRSPSDADWARFKARLEAGELEPYTRDRRYVRKDGREVWGRLSVAPVRDARGRVEYIVSICTDITEARAASERIGRLNEELETRVRERTAELEGLVRELESFSYTISHDLRSPLRSMGGFAELLLQTHAAALPGEARHMLGRIRANARRMSDLLDGLLAFARLGRRALANETVSMGGLADETWKELMPELEGRKVRFTRGGLPDAEGDPVLLKQVWANLLSNALKYSRGRDPAEVEVGWDPAERAYFVRDNGAGFDMQYADKLFGVFSRLHGDEEFEGTGLGLAICERILRRHGGGIRGEGRPGAGATFFFSV